MRDYPLPDTDDHNQPVAHIGLKDISRFIESHSVEIQGQLHDLVGQSQHVEAVLKPFQTGDEKADAQWQASEAALTRVVNAYLAGRHAIDMMPGKTYSKHVTDTSPNTRGSAAIAANESTFLRGLRDCMKNPSLDMEQKTGVETRVAAQLNKLSEIQR